MDKAREQTEKAHKKAAAAAKSEPWYVAHLCSRMPELARQWNAILKSTGRPFTLDLSSVFIHGVPHAQFGTSTCEVADLLVAIVDHRQTPAKGRATLIQAKMNSSHLLSLNKPESVQLELLGRRPRFALVKPRLPKINFDISGVARDATMYGGAFRCGRCYRHKCRAFPPTVVAGWTAGNAVRLPSTTDEVLLDRSMSNVFVDLLFGWLGEPFDYDPTMAVPSGSWSHLINYLLRQAGDSSYMGKAATGASHRRIRHGVMHLQLGTGAAIRHFFQYGAPEYTASLFNGQSKSVRASGDGGDDDFNLQIGEGEPEGGAPSVIMFEIRGENGRAGLDTAEVDS